MWQIHVLLCGTFGNFFFLIFSIRGWLSLRMGIQAETEGQLYLAAWCSFCSPWVYTVSLKITLTWFSFPLRDPHLNLPRWMTISAFRKGFNHGEGNGSPLQYSCLENPMDRGVWWAADLGVTQSRTWLLQLSMHALEKEMATHSSVLVWRIPGMEEPGGLPSMGSHRVGHDWSDLATSAVYIYIYTYTHTHTQ